MIDPNNIINFNRTDAELEELILFLVCVAGKKASTVSKLLQDFLGRDTNMSPFQVIRFLINRKDERIPDYNHLEGSLIFHRFGQYKKLERAFRELAGGNLNLRTCTKEDLMKIHGIGRKSASCFIAWTRKGSQVAMLDTHLLKYLRHVQSTGDYLLKGRKLDDEKLYHWLGRWAESAIPKTTPSSKKQYDDLERFFLSLARLARKSPTEFDLEIWKYYANKEGTLI